MDSRVLLTAGYDGKAYLWDVEKGTEIKYFDEFGQRFFEGQFSHDGFILFSFSFSFSFFFDIIFSHYSISKDFVLPFVIVLENVHYMDF